MRPASSEKSRISSYVLDEFVTSLERDVVGVRKSVEECAETAAAAEILLGTVKNLSQKE